ncbi:MAG: family 20 glycosylhydrolase [Saprospirales bacterium]|nr:family 20 glycosylhydrolase [Saprospirales bacterium]
MRKIILIAYLVSFLQNIGVAQSILPANQPALIPFPAKWAPAPGINQLHSEKDINWIQDSSIVNPEGYRLQIRPEKVVVYYREPAGAFYAKQTLQQLKNTDGSLPCLDIEDAPRFPYRGMHLDVARHFFPVEFIKEYIDLLAMHKMNYFHWHLTEDQGWRIEIKKYPRLQEVSAWRKETLVGHYSDQPHQFDGQLYGGYYTQEEIREVVQYARERFVTIIPEIEMPGHAQALLAAYPELSCHGQPVEVATEWGVFENVLCPTEETFTFMENVLLEVMDLFPGPYIHIGGDECPKIQWKESAFCQELMKKEGLKDENELQSYFIRRIDRFLTEHGRKLVGWDEILEGGLSPNATVLSWRGMQGGIDAAQGGHDVIMAPTSHCYFDYYQSKHPNEPLAIGGYLPLEKVYAFEPVPETLSQEEAMHILGAQGNVWTEYIPTTEQVEYMAFPRALALAEVLWSPLSKRDFLSFQNRLAQYLPKLDIHYADHLFDIRYELDGAALLLSNRMGLPMWVQAGGQSPALYTQPIPILTDTRIQAWRAAADGEPIGRLLDLDFHTHAAFGKRVTWTTPPHPNYQLGGTQALTNGILGNKNRYGDGEWLGWWGSDVELEVDLQEPQSIQNLQLRFFQSQGQWIYLPREVELFYSDDGIQFQSVAREAMPSTAESVLSFGLTFPETKARYWKMVITRFGKIPDGAQGAGNEAWIFLDEWILAP